MSLHRVTGKIGERAQRDRDGTRSDGHVSRWHADDVYEQGYRQYGPASANEAEYHSDDTTGEGRQ